MAEHHADRRRRRGGATRLKQQPGKDISITGSGTLVRTLLRDGLLDELRLLVHPIVVGNGKRLFEEGASVPLELVDSKTFSTGVLYLTYAPADEDAGKGGRTSTPRYHGQPGGEDRHALPHHHPPGRQDRHRDPGAG